MIASTFTLSLAGFIRRTRRLPIVWALAFSLALPCSGAPKSVTETVTDALVDLRSTEIEVRKGSAMLLGKYPEEPRVMEALIGAMADPEPVVRRAAAVSIVENAVRITPEQASQLIPSLLDEDAEVRMSIAAWLPQLVLQTLRNPAFRFTRETQRPDNPVRDVLLQALGDPHHLVREKVMESVRYLTGEVPTEQLAPLLDDPAPSVRLKAVDLLATYLAPARFVEEVMAYLPEPEAAIRLATTEAMLRNPTPAHQPLVEAFKADDEPEVQVLALTLEFLIQPESDPPPALASALREDELEQSLTQRILFSSRRMQGKKALKVAELLLDSERPAIRGTALGTWLDLQEDVLSPEALYPFFNDEAIEVRRQAMRYLSRQRSLITDALLAELSGNRFLDVRQQAVRYLPALPPEAQARAAMRWLLDPEPSVRIPVLRQLGQIRPDNWPMIFRASLRDPSEEVRRTAANLLLQNFGKEGRDLARAHARENPGSSVSRLIEARLRQLDPPPPS